MEGEIQFTFEEFQSGETISAIYLALVDKYGQVVGKDFSRYI
jgi:hypothetical protein